MRYLLLTIFLLLSSHSAYACYDQGQSDKANFDNCMAQAQQGNAIAQFFLGQLYKNGDGVTQDSKQYVQWNRKSAEQGFAPAQYNVALWYDLGKGVKQDYKQAVQWYRKSAEQGHAPAQFKLGLLYSDGQGVTQDYVLAHMWLNIAASSGNKNATKTRDILAKKMSSSQIEKAQDMAREWTAKH